MNYDADGLEERTLERIEDCFPAAEDPPVTWVNIDGLHDVSVIEKVGERFGLHRLALEDVLSVSQRPKVEDYENHLLFIGKMLSFDAATESVVSEQLSLIVGPSYLFSFQERRGDVFEPVRERLRHGKGKIRSRGPDYLAYALIDTIVDNYFRIMEEIGDRIEDIEDEVLRDPSIELMHRIHHLRREMLVLRRAVWPLRETLGQMYRGEIPHVEEQTRLYLRLRPRGAGHRHCGNAARGAHRGHGPAHVRRQQPHERGDEGADHHRHDFYSAFVLCRPVRNEFRVHAGAGHPLGLPGPAGLHGGGGRRHAGVFLEEELVMRLVALRGYPAPAPQQSIRPGAVRLLE
jgi:hypothetical protein